MNSNHSYAFYGSLRKGCYNHSYIQNSLDYIKTETIPGYLMYSLGGYPCIVKSMNENDTIVVELYKIKDYSTEGSVHRMELGAGYNYEEIEVAGEKFGIYVYSRPPEPTSERLVPGGDWVKYLRLNNESE